MRSYVNRVAQISSKLTKEQILTLLNNLVDENEDLHSILESINCGLLILDENFCLKQNNTVVLSKLPFLIHPDDSKSSIVPIWEILDDDDVCSFFKKCYEKSVTNSTEEFTLSSSTGVKFINIMMSPLVHNGKLSGSVVLVRDITEKKNQEVLVRRMENLASLTNLAAGMAHEIKNPLGAISIHIQLVQKALEKARENNDILPDKKFVEKHIDIVNEEIEALNKLVIDFLFAVRPLKAQLELKNPAKVIRKIVEFFIPEFNSYQVDIECNFPKNSPKILLDEKLMRELILNLSQNSLHAIQKRFPECQEQVSSCKNFIGHFSIEGNVKDNRYIIKISDNGCGMDEKTIEKVFEPYYTTTASGTGLGMTMVYKIIKEFSGDIQVNSVVDQGTTFTLSFPISQKDKKLITESSENI